MHYDDGSHDAPDPDQRQEVGAPRRAILFEESLRAATALMVVVFSVSMVTAFPLVPDWAFAAALGGVALSVPAAVHVRVRDGSPYETRTVSALWNSALIGTATFGLLVVLLLVVAGVTGLGSGLVRLSGVLVALGIVARLRGWRPMEPASTVDREGHDPDA